MNILLLNALVYLFTLVIAYWHFRRINLYVIIWICYTIVAVMGYLSVLWGMHYSEDIHLGEKVSWIPYFFAYITIVFLSSLFYNVKENEIDLNEDFPASFKLFFKIIAALFLFRAIFAGISAYVVANTIGFGEAYTMGHDGDYVDVFNSPLLSRVLRLSLVLTNGFTPFYVFHYFRRIAKEEGKFWNNVLYIVLAFCPTLFSSIAGGSKGGLFFLAMSIVFYFLLIKPHISLKNTRKLTILGILLAGLLIFYVILISISRIESHTKHDADSEQQTNEIVHYLGEAYPNLGYFYWDKVDEHPYGRRFFPEFFIGENIESNYKGLGIEAKFNYWENITHVPMATFKTFWGDWYIEFGLWGSFIAIIVLYYIFYIVVFRKYYLFSHIGLLSLYYNSILMRGCFTGNGLEGSSVHYGILLTIVISIYINKVVLHRKALIN